MRLACGVIPCVVFVLLATACGGGGGSNAPSAGDPTDPELGPLTVEARVETPMGMPLSGVPVVIDGLGPFVTDLDGRVQVSGVAERYDAYVLDGWLGVAHIYRGITRPDPTFEIDKQLLLFSSNLDGSVTGGVGWPMPGDHALACSAFVDRHGSAGTFGPSPASGGFVAALEWRGSAASLARLFSLQYQVASNGLAQEFTGYGELTVPVQGGEDLIGQTIAMAAVGTVQVQGRTFFPWDYAPLGRSSYVRLSSGARINLPTDGTPDEGFTVRYPDIPDARLGLSTSALGPDGTAVTLRVEGLPAGGTSLLFDVPNGTVLIMPPDQATDVHYDTDFQLGPWLDDRVHEVIVQPLGGGPELVIHTREYQFTLPDLSAYGFGLVAGGDYQWKVRSHGPLASVDDMLVSGWTDMRIPGDDVRFVADGIYWRFFSFAP